MVDTGSNANHWDMFWAEHASKRNLFHQLLWRIRLLFTKAYARHLVHVASATPGVKILEVGCGSARTMHYLEKQCPGSQCYAFDISSAALRLVRRTNPSYHTSITNALTLPSRHQAFDIVFSIGLIEHFSRAQARQIVSENVRVTKPGGYVGIVVPWKNSVYNLVVRKAFGRLWPFGNENPFRRKELAGFMEDLGLRDIQMFVLYGSTLLAIGRRAADG